MNAYCFARSGSCLVEAGSPRRLFPRRERVASGSPFLKQLTSLALQDDVLATAGKFMQAFRKVNQGLTLHNPVGGHGILFVEEQVIRGYPS